MFECVEILLKIGTRPIIIFVYLKIANSLST
jgi:hypothetical protein